MRRKIPDVANRVKVVGDVAGQLLGIENLLDLVRQILFPDGRLLSEQELQAPTARAALAFSLSANTKQASV
jgi:hypothetical protein